MTLIALKQLTTIFALFLLISPFSSKCQSNSGSSLDLKKGTFNYYRKNSTEHFKTNRNGDSQTEINNRTGDTLLFKINWINDRSYALKYISSSGKSALEIPGFLKKHTLVYQVVNVTNDYYVYKGYVDRITKHAIQTDTMWVKEKTYITNNLAFKEMGPSKLKR